MKTRPSNWLRHGALALAAALGLVACGGGGGGGDGTASGNGTARVFLTDAPACGYDQVNVTVERVRLHQSDAADPEGGGWSEVVLATPQRINLLDLMNGVLQQLGSTSLPAGTYQQVRLVLADNDGSTPPANSIVLTGSGEEIALTTPSAQQSGLKINADFTVPEGQTADLVLDFDACKSIVRRGNSGQYNLKPVVRAIATTTATPAGIEGVLDIDPALANVTVAAQQNGVTLRSTAPDDGGAFVLEPIEPGSYDLVITADGRATAVITGVPVASAGRTVVGTAAVPVDLAAGATQRTVAGTVTDTATPPVAVDALVRALQSLSGGSTIEVIARQVNGSYEFLLPVEAPGVAAYDATPDALYSFTPDASGGLYTIEATAGSQTQTAPADISAADDTDVNFGFPAAP